MHSLPTQNTYRVLTSCFVVSTVPPIMEYRWVLHRGAGHGGRYMSTTCRCRARRQVHGYYVEVQNTEAGIWVLRTWFDPTRVPPSDIGSIRLSSVEMSPDWLGSGSTLGSQPGSARRESHPGSTRKVPESRKCGIRIRFGHRPNPQF